MMLLKGYLIALILVFYSSTLLLGQASNYKKVEYKIIATGNDSPLASASLVCYNKYFNLEQLPKTFQDKYKLTDRRLFKQQMLVEIFYQDVEGKGYDKIEIETIKEGDADLVVKYNLVNSDPTNDTSIQSPFLVVQVPKIRKPVRFFANGFELGKSMDLYIKN